MGLIERTRDALVDPHDDETEYDEYAFPALHWMTAAVFIAAGIESAFGQRRGNDLDGVRWAPLLAAPLAGAAHAARALQPTRATRIAAQFLNGVAIGVGIAGFASSTWAVVEDERLRADFGPRRKPISKRLPSLAPLAFGAAGMLGILLDREEREDARAHQALERRARVVERLVPKRRPRLDRIVLHI
jgi:hypothetical protein